MALVLILAARRPVWPGMNVARRTMLVYAVCWPAGARRTADRLLSGVRDEAAVLRDLCLRLQPAARLHADAVLRARGLFRRGGLCDGLADGTHGWGASPASWRGVLAGALLGAVIGAIAIRRRGHLFRDDHARAGAARVFRLPGSAASRAARTACRASPRGTLLGIMPLESRRHDVLLRAGALFAASTC